MKQVSCTKHNYHLYIQKTQNQQVTYYGLLIFIRIYFTYKYYMINSYWYDPSPNKIKMYNWSPFCVAAHIYQTPVGGREASRINRLPNEPYTKQAVKFYCHSWKQKKNQPVGDFYLELNHSHAVKVVTKPGWDLLKSKPKASHSFNKDIENNSLRLTMTECQPATVLCS